MKQPAKATLADQSRLTGKLVPGLMENIGENKCKSQGLRGGTYILQLLDQFFFLSIYSTNIWLNQVVIRQLCHEDRERICIKDAQL